MSDSAWLIEEQKKVIAVLRAENGKLKGDMDVVLYVTHTEAAPTEPLLPLIRSIMMAARIQRSHNKPPDCSPLSHHFRAAMEVLKGKVRDLEARLAAATTSDARIGGGGGGLMSSRGTANILTRATAVLAVAFFATSLTLSLIAKNQDRPGSILDAVPTATQEAPATTDGTTEGGSGGVLDSLKQLNQQQPSGPQVPAAQ